MKAIYLKVAEPSWFDDNLGATASHAAAELDFIRLARPHGDWNIRILSGWLLDVSRGLAPFYPSCALIVHRAVQGWQPERDGSLKTIDGVRTFAGEMGLALGQAIWFDPTPAGLDRRSVMYFCLELSRFGMVDSTYRRNGNGRWRRPLFAAAGLDGGGTG